MLKKIGMLLAALFVMSLTVNGGNYSIHGTTNKKVAIYKPGEKMEFTFRVLDGTTPTAGKKLKWTRTGDDGKTEHGEGIAGIDGLKVSTFMNKPGFVRMRVKAFGEDGESLQGYIGGWGANKKGDIFFEGGACVDPEKLKSIKEPVNFDEFWNATKAKLDKVPIKVEKKELSSNNPKVKLFAVKIDCAGPKPVTGYLTIPADAKKKSLKAIVKFQGYGVRKHNPPKWLNPNAITLDINAHGMELGKDDVYFNKLKKELKKYCFNKQENSNRKTTYFYGMALRVLRALQFVKTLPEWNGKELESNGGSQGGLQGLWGAALDKDVTSSSVWSPWCCDLGGISVGRLRGWRPDYNKELDYFDPVFHAKRIKCKVHLIANYGDYTCPPSGVWIAYNNIPHNNKSIEMRQGCKHSFKMKNYMQYTFTPDGIKNIVEKNK